MNIIKSANILLLDQYDLFRDRPPRPMDMYSFGVPDKKYWMDASLALFIAPNGETTIIKNRWGNPTSSKPVNEIPNPGYHMVQIPKGELGEFSKIKEECLELEDALNQGSEVMALVELADLYGAIESYLEKHHKLTVGDLKKFSDITKRAFKNGRRS
jgi:hypothetical protein